MKKIIFLMLMAWGFSMFSSQVYSQNATETENNERLHVKMNALAVIGIFNPAVEFKVFDRGTVQLEGIGIFYPSGFLGSDKPLTLGATFGEFRYYPKKAFQGFFAGANAGWGVYRLTKSLSPGYAGTYPDSYQVGNNMMFGLTLGYTFHIGKHWSIEACWGAGWQDSTYEGFNYDGSRYVTLNGSGEWLPIYKGGIFVGYRF